MAAPVELVKRVPLFARLNDRELKTLAVDVHRAVVPRPAQNLTTRGAGRRRVLRDRVGPGERHGGRRDARDARPRRLLRRGSPRCSTAARERTATITAASDGRSYGLTSWQFRPLVEEHSSIAWPLLEALAARSARSKRGRSPTAQTVSSRPSYACSNSSSSGQLDRAVRDQEPLFAPRPPEGVVGLGWVDQVPPRSAALGVRPRAASPRRRRDRRRAPAPTSAVRGSDCRRSTRA